MKLKLFLRDDEKSKDFLSIIKFLARYEEKIIMIVRQDSMQLLTSSDKSKAEDVWFDIDKSFFETYIMAGVDEDVPSDNMIYIEFLGSNMQGALNSLNKGISSIEIKLTKQEFPCLSIRIIISSQETTRILELNNQVPVVIIPRALWKSYVLPEDIELQVSAMLPRQKVFKSYVETYKNCLYSVQVNFQCANRVILRAIQPSSKLTTIFKKIAVIDAETGEPYKGKIVSVTLESKRLFNYCSLQHSLFKNLRTRAFLSHQMYMKLCFNKNHFCCNVILPALFDDDDEEDGVNSDSDIR